MNGIHDAGIPACPTCGQVDRVAAVPAAYLAGRDAIRVAVPGYGAEPAHTELRQVSPGLAGALAPVPMLGLRPFRWGCLGFLSMLSFLGATAALALDLLAPTPTQVPAGVYPDGSGPVGGGWPDLSWLGYLAGAGYALVVVLLVLLAAPRVRFNRKIAGRARAEELWARGWYCGRCATVHFRAEPGEPSRAMTLPEFRRLVWSAGGYGDLADRYPLGSPIGLPGF